MKDFNREIFDNLTHNFNSKHSGPISFIGYKVP